MFKIRMPQRKAWLQCFLWLVFCTHASTSLATDFAEDFSTLTLKDISATTANWSTTNNNVSLPWITKQMASVEKFSPSSISGSRRTRSIITVDIDGDGDMDILEGNDGQTNRVYLNNGHGTFAGGSTIWNTIKKTRSLVTADIDGDGDLDVLTGNYNQHNFVYFNHGDGTFDHGTEISNVPSALNKTFSLTMADIDGDGDIDVLEGNFNQANRVYLNDGNGNFDDGTDISLDVHNTYSITTAGHKRRWSY